LENASSRGQRTGVWGCAPSGVQEQSPWSGGLGAKGIGERSHPEAETLFAFGLFNGYRKFSLVSKIRKKTKSDFSAAFAKK